MFQDMICLISLSLFLPLQTYLFKILLNGSEIYITFGFLFFTQQKLKLLRLMLSTGRIAVPQAPTLERSEATSLPPSLKSY